MATWPAGLPQYLESSGFQYTQQDQFIRTEMDAGPDFQRRRYTAASTLYGGNIQVTSSQHTTFWNFYNSTLNGGVDSFTWEHPITESAATVRFTATPTQSHLGGDLYQISIQLEIEP